MKYQCSAGHKFVHPAKFIDTFPVYSIRLEDHEVTQQISGTIEYAVCPICDKPNKVIEEFAEPQEAITSVKSVDLAQVDDFLKQGYVVRELYAKTATLVKLEAQP